MKKRIILIIFLCTNWIVFTQSRIVAIENLGNYPLSYKPMVIIDSSSYLFSEYNYAIGYRAYMVNVFQENSLHIIDSLIVESSKKYSFIRDTVLSREYYYTKKSKKERKKEKKIPESTYRIFSCGKDGILKYNFVIIGQKHMNIFFDDIRDRMKSIPKDDDVWLAWDWFESYKEDVEYYMNL